MFFSRRGTQAEYFDSARPDGELADFYDSLGRVNRFFHFEEPFQRLLPHLLGDSECRSLSLLDLGAGDGALGRVLTVWAGQRKWEWRVTDLDHSPAALRLGTSGRKVAASALALPFRDSSYDVVIASQMTHHLGEAEVQQHLQEAWRVARKGILLCDLHRNVALYGLLWLFFQVQRHPLNVRSDALVSVRRAWRVPELRRLAVAAGIQEARAQLYFGARILLLARKTN